MYLHRHGESGIHAENTHKEDNMREVRGRIHSDALLYKYCVEVADVEDIWSRIRDPYIAAEYCIVIKNRPEVARHA